MVSPLQTWRVNSFHSCLMATLLLACAAGGPGWATESGSAITPKPLVDVNAPEAIKQIRQNYGDPEYKVDKTGISVSLPAARQLSGNSSHPSHRPILGSFALRSRRGQDHQYQREADTTHHAGRQHNIGRTVSNAEVIGVEPGKSKVIKVIFGYNFGFRPANQAVDSAKVTLVILCLGKTDHVQSFRVEDFQAAGPVGEKPPFNPDYVVTKPAGGVILGPGESFDVAKQAQAAAATISAGPNGSITVSLAGSKAESLKLKPAMGSWDLSDANEIRVKFKNVGQTAVTPRVAVGPNTVPAQEPIAPGAEAEIAVSFIPKVTTVCPKELLTRSAEPLPGTGSKFESNKAKEVSVLFDGTPGAKSLLVTSVIADAVVDDGPAWLGKRPPVAGDWVQTFDEEFDGPTLDYKKWNIYGNNFWDKRTHFSKDNAILKDGKMIFRYEKKAGPHNDDPNDFQADHRQTGYACGFLNTYGKFTQRYGYFEARMKLPTAPGLWPAFWLMPDRGKNSRSRHRPGTGKQDCDAGVGGMEFDIMEFLSGWGTYRFNIACHWDGYGKEHKSVGSDRTYVYTDQEKYVTTGLLWTPGSAVVYNNGKEVFRWENPRVADVHEYLMFDMVSGGWDNTPLDDAKLPDDFTIDYVRVWQRKDLASPADGPKPNQGIPDERKN